MVAILPTGRWVNACRNHFPFSLTHWYVTLTRGESICLSFLICWGILCGCLIMWPHGWMGPCEIVPAVTFWNNIFRASWKLLGNYSVTSYHNAHNHDHGIIIVICLFWVWLQSNNGKCPREFWEIWLSLLVPISDMLGRTADQINRERLLYGIGDWVVSPNKHKPVLKIVDTVWTNWFLQYHPFIHFI